MKSLKNDGERFHAETETLGFFSEEGGFSLSLEKVISASAENVELVECVYIMIDSDGGSSNYDILEAEDVATLKTKGVREFLAGYLGLFEEGYFEQWEEDEIPELNFIWNANYDGVEI